MAKQTLAERIANTEALLAKYKAKQKSIAIVNNVEVGDTVTIKYGRGDKVRNISGSVVGIKDENDVRSVVVLGEDFKPYTVRAADITENAAAAARGGIELTAEEAALAAEVDADDAADELTDADAAAAASDADPLANA